jgi:hypothetical protein
MRNAIRKAIIRLVLLEVLTAIILSTMVDNAAYNAHTLPGFLLALGRLYWVAWPFQPLFVFEALHRFCQSYSGPISSGSSASSDDDTDSRRRQFDWPTENRPEFNSNGSIMYNSSTDATGHIRGDTHL